MDASYSQMGSNEGFQVLKELGSYEFEIRLLSFSQVYKSIDIKSKGGYFTVLKDEVGGELINAMNTCSCESYLWLTRTPSAMDKHMNSAECPLR